MNIFALDIDPKRCSEYHNNAHCVKMILETTQLLNNALILSNKDYTPVYRLTHKNHPATRWVASSRSNYEWLSELGIALCREYTHRYARTHKCQSILERLQVEQSKSLLPNCFLTSFVKCMPDEYKVDDPIQSYRNYYIGAKRHIAKWTRREVPEWWH